jgi:hypothetical protein
MSNPLYNHARQVIYGDPFPFTHYPGRASFIVRWPSPPGKLAKKDFMESPAFGTFKRAEEYRLALEKSGVKATISVKVEEEVE